MMLPMRATPYRSSGDKASPGKGRKTNKDSTKDPQTDTYTRMLDTPVLTSLQELVRDRHVCMYLL